MSKSNVIYCILSIVLIAFLAVTLCYAVQFDKATPYGRLDISIEERGAAGFVTADDIDQQIGSLRSRIASIPADSLNTLAIERKVMEMDNIESVNCVLLNNRTMRLDVTPLIPVARVFDTSVGETYYINRQGKRMRATTQFRIDAPVVVGDFSWRAQPTDALPILDYLNEHPDMGSLVSSIKINKRGDIVIVPMIRGHVVCFGDNKDVANKFDRLRTFYRKVMPTKGWEYYDTISVKWGGQVVAHRHDTHVTPVNIPEEDEPDVDDESTIMP